MGNPQLGDLWHRPSLAYPQRTDVIISQSASSRSCSVLIIGYCNTTDILLKHHARVGWYLIPYPLIGQER